MTEKERQNIIKNIKNELIILNIKNYKLKQLKNLEQKTLIQKYLKLKEELQILDKEFKYLEGKEDYLESIIVKNFTCSINSKGFSPCKHSLWMYVGSYYEWLDYYCEHSHDIRVNDENDKGFEFNRYCCIECCESVDEKDWQKFEKTHFVLKDKNQLDVKSYHRLYYQLLYENTIEEAQKKIIETFKEKGKIKIKK